LKNKTLNLEQMKTEEQNLDNPQNPQLNIGAVSSSASNGFRPDVYISDDLEDLKRRYTPEQIKKMWEDCYPKSSEIIGTPIITGTPK
jgi:hypothetical protein